MHKSIITILAFALFLSLASCAGKSQSTSYYVLQGAAPSQLEGLPPEALSVGVGPVTLPGHLDRQQIVVSTGQHTIEIKDFHRFGDTLRDQFAETLTANLSALLQSPQVIVYPWERELTPRYQVYVQVQHFEGEQGGSVTLDAIWRVADLKLESQSASKRFTITTPAKGASINDYVAAQSQALQALGTDIAKGIVEMVK